MKDRHTTTFQMRAVCEGEGGDRGRLKELPFCLILWSPQVEEGCLPAGWASQSGKASRRRTRSQEERDSDKTR